MFIELYDYFYETAKEEGHTIEESHFIALNKTKGDINNVQENKNSGSNCTSGIRKEK